MSSKEGSEAKPKVKRKKRDHLLLIDASNLFYRSHHAFSKHGMTSPDGMPVGALYGTMKSLQGILKINRPTHCAFVMDGKSPNFRHELYPEYKAGRPKMPDELIYQIKLIKKLAKYMGIPVLKKDYHEADDLIGTLARRGQALGMFVTIHSGDKDFCQLVGTRVVVFNPNKGRVYNTDAILKAYGIRPKQFVDYLAMMGDSVDNIPGIAGVGPKTAMSLLQTHGSLAGVIGARKSLPGKLGQTIKEQRVAALMSQKLAQIHCQVKGLPKVGELTLGPELTEQFKAFKKKLGFRDGTGQGIRKAAKKPKKEVYTPSKSLF